MQTPRSGWLTAIITMALLALALTPPAAAQGIRGPSPEEMAAIEAKAAQITEAAQASWCITDCENARFEPYVYVHSDPRAGYWSAYPGVRIVPAQCEVVRVPAGMTVFTPSGYVWSANGKKLPAIQNMALCYEQLFWDEQNLEKYGFDYPSNLQVSKTPVATSTFATLGNGIMVDYTIPPGYTLIGGGKSLQETTAHGLDIPNDGYTLFAIPAGPGTVRVTVNLTDGFVQMYSSQVAPEVICSALQQRAYQVVLNKTNQPLVCRQ